MTTKEQFFYKNFGAEIKLNEYISNKYELFDSQVLFDDGAHDASIDDCQIIGRRIGQMTTRERQEFFLLYRNDNKFIIEQDAPNVYPVISSSIIIKTECVNYLNSIQVFPDAYFDELKWCVEEKK